MRLLPEGAVRQYQEQGYYAPVRAVSSADAATLRARLEAHEATAGRLAGPLRQKSHLLFT
jgi:non-heme Fe2+,alpha-ketoglutarate-dependent halogenase